MKVFILLLCILFNSFAHSMQVGFNQAWFKNDYASQYLDGTYDAVEVERVFALAHQAGAKQLRLWLFEGADFPMLEWEGKDPMGIRPDFVKNFIHTLEIARRYDVKVYATIFDAHSYRPDLLSRFKLKRLRALFHSDGGQKFLMRALRPFLQAIHEKGLSSQISRIDLINEGDTVINRWGYDLGWKGAEQMICQWRGFIQSHAGFYQTPVTMSLRLHPLIFHPANLLADNGPLKCADYIDFHSYNDKGNIYRCNWVKRYVERRVKPVILGEFGQSFFNHEYDDHLHVANTEAYLREAQACGFEEALAWRLSDVRPGYNKEARYSFEAYGKPRAAYYVIQEHNQSLELK